MRVTLHLAPARAGRASERSVVRSCAGHWPEPGPASLPRGGCRGVHLLALSVQQGGGDALSEAAGAITTLELCTADGAKAFRPTRGHGTCEH